MRQGRLILAMLLPFLATQDLCAAVPTAAEDWAAFDKPGKFITALCATDDALWIGTEDKGLWRLGLKADPPQRIPGGSSPPEFREFGGHNNDKIGIVSPDIPPIAGLPWKRKNTIL